jgi:hypothetical protein
MPVVETVRLFSVAHLGEGIPCAESTLGLRLHINVNSVEGWLEMPKPATQESGREGTTPLLASPESYTLSADDKDLLWGHATFPNKPAVCAVQRVFLYFDVPKHLEKAHANTLHAGLLNWRNSFVGHLHLLTKHRLYPDILIQNYEQLSVQLFTHTSDGRKIRPHGQTPLTIMIVTGNPDTSAKEDSLAIAARHASLEIPAEYALQLASYQAFGRKDHRHAIIETAAAAEICLTSAIAQRLQAGGIGYGDKLLSRFRMLGGRFELARMLQIPLGDIDFQKQLIDLRNDVVHKGMAPDHVTAQRAIKCCDDLLAKLSPLA